MSGSPWLTWGGGARSWPLVKASDAAPPRADSEPTGLCSGDRHAHPHGPGLWSQRGWRLRALSTPQTDPYHRDFRRLLRAPPCRRRRGTVLLRLRSGGDAAGRAHPRPRPQEEACPEREKTDGELPGPRVGVRGIGLFKNKPGQAVKFKPDLNTLNYWNAN